MSEQELQACFLKDTNEVGIIVELLADPATYVVQVHGEARRVSPYEVELLETEELMLIGKAIKVAAKAIDSTDKEVQRSRDGEIVYSSAAESALRAIGFPEMIVEMRKLRRGR